MHWFTINGEYFLYDTESGSLHVIDKIVFDVLEGNTEGYSKEETAEVSSEIQALKSQGLIDAQPPQIHSHQTHNEIKALCVHLSHDCNLNCKYCFAGQGAYHGTRQHMSFDTAKAAVDFLIEKSGNRKNLEIDFFGGEPLMNLDVLKRIVQYIEEQSDKHGKHFKLTTTTNGLLLSEETAQYLNEKMDNVVLSLDGRKEVHDRVRPTINGRGSYDLITEKFKYFRSIRGSKDYFVRGTFTSQNTDFCDDVLSIAELGFDQISMEPVVLPIIDELALKESDVDKVVKEYEKLALEYVKRRKSKDTWFSFFHFVVELDNGPCYFKKITGCGAGVEYLSVTPDGNIYPCHQFAGEKEYLLGNVFDKVLNQDIMNVFRASNLTTKEECKKCWARYHCSGGCAANAVHFNGDINKPYTEACRMIRKRLECALYVYAKEFDKSID